MTGGGPRTPWWMGVIIVVVSLPVFALPYLLSQCAAELKTFVWLYPLYVVVAAWLAWICYPRRRLLTWILLIIMALTHVAMFTLATKPVYMFM